SKSAHRVGLAAPGRPVGQSDVYELGDGGKRRLPTIRWLVVGYIGQAHRQLFKRHGHLTISSMYDGNGCSPIALAADSPVAEFVIDRTFAPAGFFEPSCNLSHGDIGRDSVKRTRLDHDALSRPSCVHCLGVQRMAR